jgi:UDP-N-acetylmuramate--alanine ligase
MNLKKAKNIHFIGIGGIGTSSLAQILLGKEKKISGSDNCPSDIIESLEKNKIKIFNDHSEKNINSKIDLIIYSPAIPKDNPELIAAKSLKITTISYPDAVGELSQDYYTIAIAGTHGKSTTTAMLSLIAIEADLDPSIIIGTKIKELDNQNSRVGESPYLIIEACEYKESFLEFEPNILIITNVEADHLDHYGNEENYINAFNKLAKKVPQDGAIIINKDDENSVKAVEGAKAQLVTWSREKEKGTADLVGNELVYELPVDDQVTAEQKIKLEPQLPGEFNVENACFAALSGLLLQIDHQVIEKSIKTYSGSWRRFEYKKVKGINTTIIDDYGHHPTEIKATLKAIREKYPQEKVLVIFQPHQYSRTKFFLEDFATSFDNADEVIIPNIYQVRDSKDDVESVSVDNLVREIRKHHKHVKNGGGLETTAKFIKENHKKYDVIVTMGAGDIEGIYKMF